MEIGQLASVLPVLKEKFVPIIATVASAFSKIADVIKSTAQRFGLGGIADATMGGLLTKTGGKNPSAAAAQTVLGEANIGGALGAPKLEKPVEAPKPDPPAGGKGKEAVDKAHKYLGTPYVWGGTTPKGFDCSGFTQYVMKEVGIDIPRVAADQAKAGKPVKKEDMQPGDLMFFSSSGGPITHVGMYIGDGKMIHSPTTGDTVKIADVTKGYHAEKFINARRFT